MGENKILDVPLDHRSYKIIIGQDLINNSGQLVKDAINGDRVIVVTDTNIAPLYLSKLLTSLKSSNIKFEQIIIPSGENSKSFEGFQNLTNQILSMRIDRKTTLIALGGGVIGDLTGFAASTLLRGIDFIQIPTTLLAQVDSSVGGKTAINSPIGKNLIGAFYQPRLVISDISVLKTLPQRELVSGYAEIVKYGLIYDHNFFSWLEKIRIGICSKNDEFNSQAIFRSCEIKTYFVCNDETEQNKRGLLNFGHTFGHALESETNFSGKILHGEAVSIGMTMAFELSHSLGLCSSKDKDRMMRHLRSVGLPTKIRDIKGIKWNSEAIINHMHSDKKVKNGKIMLILTTGIGSAHLASNVSKANIIKTIEKSI